MYTIRFFSYLKIVNVFIVFFHYYLHTLFLLPPPPTIVTTLLSVSMSSFTVLLDTCTLHPSCPKLSACSLQPSVYESVSILVLV